MATASSSGPYQVLGAERSIACNKIVQGRKISSLLFKQTLPVLSYPSLDKSFKPELRWGTFHEPEWVIKAIEKAKFTDLLEPRLCCALLTEQHMSAMDIQGVLWEMTNHAEECELLPVEDSFPWQASSLQEHKGAWGPCMEPLKVHYCSLVVTVN